MMLFLVKTEVVRMPNMDQDTFMTMVKEQWSYILDLKKKGKFIEAYRMSGRKGGIAIADVESHGELNRILSMMPIYPWLETEAIPLISLEEESSRVPS
jgi:muconolactone D-isomerase